MDTAIEQALKPRISAANKPVVDKAIMMHEFESPFSFQGQAGLRFVLSPEREEEVFDPMTLSSASFKQQIYALGHSGQVPIFSYQKSKTDRIERVPIVLKTDAL